MEPHMICLHNKEECLTTYRWLFDFFKIYSNNFEKYLSCHFSRDPKFVLKTNKHNRKAIWVSFSVVCFESARGADIRVRCAGREFMSSALEIKVCGKALRFQATRHHIQGWHQSLGSSGAEMSLEVPYIRTGGSDYTLSHQPHWRQTALPLHIPHSLVKIKHDLGQSSSLVKGYFCESRLNCRLPAVKNPWSREYSGSRRKFWMVYNSIHIDAHHCFYSNKQY